MIELLKDIRKNPRKMHVSYLKKVGAYDYIQNKVPNSFNIREKIDIILKNEFIKCNICNDFAKANSKWCSLKCMNKDPSMHKIIGDKNRANKSVRAKKMKNTLFEKYGVYSVQDIPHVKSEARNRKLKYYESLKIERFNHYGLDPQKFEDKEFLRNICKCSSYAELSRDHFNNMPIMSILRFFKTIDFDPMFPKQTSMAERDICKFINELGISWVQNDRKIIKPYELDIVIPEYNLAIEYNGLYYHKGFDEDYHIRKTERCKEAGYQLIHIFEDEWLYKDDIVKSIIKSKLGKIENKLFARKLEFRVVENQAAKDFYERTHIQGHINGNHYGLYDDNTLVTMITVGKNRFTKGHELYRYSTELNTQVIGGFTKLIKNFKKLDNIELKTYSDIRYFNGDIYRKIGRYTHQTKPSYFWIKKPFNERISRYRTQKHKLETFLGNSYDPNLTEDQNMENAGYYKIYDCGHLAFIL